MSSPDTHSDRGGPGSSINELAELLDEIVAFIRRHVLMQEDEAVAIALWIAHCHVHAVATHSPVLLVRSPTMRSGKTTLLTVVGLLVPKPVHVSHTSTAAIYRFAPGSKPTLLLDEAEHYVNANNRDLIAILNANHRREGSKILRTVETRR